MPKGHKPDCQCAACKRKRDKAAKPLQLDGPPAPIETPAADEPADARKATSKKRAPAAVKPVASAGAAVSESAPKGRRRGLLGGIVIVVIVAVGAAFMFKPSTGQEP